MPTHNPGDQYLIAGPDHAQWNDYVKRHPQGTIFHTSAMIASFGATPQMQPYALAAVNAAEEIVAMLVSVHVKTLGRFDSLSSRAIQYAAPLCDPNQVGSDALYALVQKHDRYMRSRSLFTEVRCITASRDEKPVLTRQGYDHLDYINYEVDLRQSPEELWSKVAKRMRQKIRSTQRRGIEIIDDNNLDGVKRLYQLLLFSYGKAAVPLTDRRLFESVLDKLPAESVRIRTAMIDGVPVASIISLIYGERIFSWFGGTLRINGHSPFACIVWDDIVWACENGLKIYDFGGAGWPHENYGPRRFKASFGGEETRHGRYRAIHSMARLRLAKIGYGFTRQLGAWS
ncbi:MAG: GNAT family N-acetyltransferase [Planctomycetales bacterium]|nr:GNAT family N-acetyltransferase [Planctomycetales bacterium]